MANLWEDATCNRCTITFDWNLTEINQEGMGCKTRGSFPRQQFLPSVANTSICIHMFNLYTHISQPICFDQLCLFCFFALLSFFAMCIVWGCYNEYCAFIYKFRETTNGNWINNSNHIKWKIHCMFSYKTSKSGCYWIHFYFLIASVKMSTSTLSSFQSVQLSFEKTHRTQQEGRCDVLSFYWLTRLMRAHPALWQEGRQACGGGAHQGVRRGRHGRPS